MSIRRNKKVGRIGEEIHRIKRLGEGKIPERTGIGSDYSVSRDWITGRKIPKEYDEVKTGNAEQSDLQRKTQRKKKRYNVERYRL